MTRSSSLESATVAFRSTFFSTLGGAVARCHVVLCRVLAEFQSHPQRAFSNPGQDAVDDAFLVEVDGQAWRFISPTSLCLFKILFLSESSPERVLLKHIEDIYALLEVSKIPVDRRYVSASVSKLLPSTDFRFKRHRQWREVVQHTRRGFEPVTIQNGMAC